MAAKKPVPVEHRVKKNNRSAILLIHGFGGDAAETWGRFPKLLSSDKRLHNWNIHSLGYDSRLRIDIVGLWRADPPLASLADYLTTASGLPPLAGYERIALMAHSMGGLIAQRALLDSPELTGRTKQVMLFGTPSAGLAKASWLRRLKRQIRDMGRRSEFIKSLRADWKKSFSRKRPFEFLAIGGLSDTFVDRATSVEPFPIDCRRMVPGDHLSIVKPETADELSVQLVLKALTGKSVKPTAVALAQTAVEQRHFRKAVRVLEPNEGRLDDPARWQLALALDGLGRQDEAIAMLQKHGHSATDAMGVLAGRLKRRWLHERERKDAAGSLALYEKAYKISNENSDHRQAFYHSINIAFMLLAYRKDRPAAREKARLALAHCLEASKTEPARSKTTMWRLATEAEAHLVLGDPKNAIARYGQLVGFRPAPTQRELDSIYQQALHVVGLAGSEKTAGLLEAIFRGDDSKS